MLCLSWIHLAFPTCRETVVRPLPTHDLCRNALDERGSARMIHSPCRSPRSFRHTAASPNRHTHLVLVEHVVVTPHSWDSAAQVLLELRHCSRNLCNGYSTHDDVSPREVLVARREESRNQESWPAWGSGPQTSKTAPYNMSQKVSHVSTERSIP